MKIFIYLILISSLLYPVGGIITFNDGTKIEGDITSVTDNSISITPIGLSFPEEIRMESVDSLKFSNGSLLVANNKVLYLYVNGEFLKPGTNTNKQKEVPQNYAVEYVLVPNWSINIYTGYPIFKGASFREDYDKSNILYGLSVGTPYGIYAGDFFISVIAELLYYNFQKNNNPDINFGGPAFQIGLSPGIFIGDFSFSLTACTGVYQNDKGKLTSGFIAGGSIDIPLGVLLDDDDFPIELRITSRSNLISKDKGITGWLDGGISIGYEF
ncbi:MAG: hypothetical protein ACJZ12_02985 [Candidatus Neomarinimicrobiota bacterium]